MATGNGAVGPSQSAAPERVTVPVTELKELCTKALRTLGYSDEEVQVFNDVSSSGGTQGGAAWVAIGWAPVHGVWGRRWRNRVGDDGVVGGSKALWWLQPCLQLWTGGLGGGACRRC